MRDRGPAKQGQHRLISIDPGKTTTGIARFKGEALVAARLVRVPYQMQFIATDELVVEVPRVYPHSPVDPNDLIGLTLLAGFLAGRTSPDALLWFVYPSDWKGQVPKKIHNKRTLAKLGKQEREILGEKSDHNVVDAVGIGLWAIGR